MSFIFSNIKVKIMRGLEMTVNMINNLTSILSIITLVILAIVIFKNIE